ncbi:MAG: hypothetical protein ACOZJX_07400 [Pseudomonadota bacterium]
MSATMAPCGASIPRRHAGAGFPGRVTTSRCRSPRTLALAFVLSLAPGASALAAGCEAPRNEAEYAIFLSPDGSDEAIGTSASHPVRTLKRAEQLLRSAPRGKSLSFAVRFLPGTYRGLTVDWDFDAQGQAMLFAPVAGAGRGSVVIDGRGSNQTRLLTLRGPAAAGANDSWNACLTFRDLHIRNYCEAISIGDHKTTVNITGVVVEDNRFENIGSKHEDRPAPGDWEVRPVGACTAAIRLQSASGNIIRRNRFEHIENIAPELTLTKLYGPSHLHALYIAHGSSRNLIEYNQFDHFTGPAVRLRSRSDYNRIYRNEFSNGVNPPARRVKAPIYAVSQWYCASQVQQCVERERAGKAECPSIGTEIVENRASGQVPLYADESGAKALHCPGRTDDTRLVGNVVLP